MVHKTYRYLMRSVLGVGFLLLLLSAAFYIWVVTGPRSLPALNPYLERGLASVLPGFHFHIKTNIIQWDQSQNTLDVRVKDVTMEGANHEPVAVFPEIKVNLTLAYAFSGALKPTDLLVFDPAFKFILSNGNLPKGNGDLYKALTEKLLVFGNMRPEQATLQNIGIRNADMLVTLSKKELLVHVDNAHTRFTYENGQLHIKNRIRATIETHPLVFDVNFTFPDKETVAVECAIAHFPSTMLKDIFPDNALLRNIDLVMNGRAYIKLARNANPVIEEFEFNNVSGSFSHPTYFIQPVKIKNLSLKGSVDPDFNQLNIEALDADFGGASLKVSGFIKQKDNAINTIVLNADALNVPVDDIHLYWPSGIKGEPARNWVVQRISKGTIPTAYAKLRVSEEDIAQKHLSANSLEAGVVFEKAAADYVDAYPPATDVSGIAKFTGKGMEVSISHANILNSVVNKASITIDNFLEHPAILTVTGEATGKSSDITNYIRLDAVNNALNTRLEQLEGTATTAVNLSIPLKRPLTLADMAIDIASQSQDASLPKLFGKYNLTHGDVRFHFNGSTIYLDGQALANEAPISFNTSTNLPAPGEKTFNGTYSVKGIFTPDTAKALFLPETKSFSGIAPFELAIQDTDGLRQYKLSADLSKTHIVLDKLGWEKTIKETMRLDTTAQGKPGNPIQISRLEISSPKGTVLSATGQLASDFSDINALNIKKLRWGRNDFAITFMRTAKANEWKITGNTIDLSKARFGKLFTASNDDNKAKPLQASVNLRQVIMKNGEEFTNTIGQVTCYSGLCQTGHLTSNIRKDVLLSMRLKSKEGKSGLNLESGRADVIARALGVFSNMQGGNLYLDAEFSKVAKTAEQPAHNFIQGLLRVENFRATKTPILAKIASLASFEGITSLLENKGIKFTRLYAPFKFENEIIFLDDAKAYGEALGITTKGRIYTADERLNLSGTFVPSYAVNNILGKIPIIGAIGDVLMGGKGAGILAVRYTVKGPYDNAEVSVNPLSILTPGFLRNLFDIVDNITPTKDKDLGNIMPASGKEIPHAKYSDI